MDSQVAVLFLAVFLGIGVTFVTSPAAILVAKRLHLLDIPGSASHKMHQEPIALAGGMALMVSLLALSAVLGLYHDADVLVLLAASCIIFAFGLWDDFVGLDAPKKLLGQGLAAVLVLSSGISIQIFESTTFFWGGNELIYVVIDRGLTLLWLVGITNAFNLIDSMDGLVVGISGWASAFFMLTMLDAQQYTLASLSALLAGSCLSLYFFNSPRAKLFLGDSGAQTLGFLMATLAILYTPQNRLQTSSWFVPILLVALPIFDTSLVFFSRMRRKIPFYKAGCDHTYHRLVLLGLDSNHAVLLLHIIALAIDCLAFFAMSLGPTPANIIFAACLLLGIVAFTFLEIQYSKHNRLPHAPS
ncbi:MAG: MraY family glycosyltransferase [Anaerolineaceae bacterium]|nr:MraY family glycosyltransferase [Anaerolineaceae bacterium]